MSHQRQKPKPITKPTISGRRLWCFRFAAMLGMPFLLLCGLELGLWLVGFGYPTAFLLPSSNRGSETFVQNGRFGWRFFGPDKSRLPQAISMTRKKTPGTIRIFVFGESAAFGDPQPRFGLPRVLEALLELRHPG